MQIDLTAEEVRMLGDILESYLSELRMEIADTDSKDFRETLKTRKAFVQELVDRLGGGGED